MEQPTEQDPLIIPIANNNNNEDDTMSDSESKPEPKSPDYFKLLLIMAVLLTIGTGVAYASLALDKNSGARLEGRLDADVSWLYLALVILGRTIGFLNFVPTSFKNGLKGNLRSNPFFFETTDGKKTMVLYQEDGTNGMYNRGNRSIQHMVENFGGVIASIGPLGVLFPKQVCFFVALFCAGRIKHQNGYLQGYGQHALGFVGTLLATVGLEGLALLAFLKGQGIVS